MRTDADVLGTPVHATAAASNAPNGYTRARYAQPAALAASVSVVIPALNEAENLPFVLPRIPPWVSEILLVDGNSRDRTVEIAKAILPNIVVILQEGAGKGAALRTGFAAARGDIIVTLDADGSADPAEIPAFVGALLAGADFVKGSRFLQGGATDDMEWYRQLGNWGLVQIVNLLFGGRFTDLCYGYNAFWRDVLPHMNLDGVDGFEIETCMNVQALRGLLNVLELPSREFRRINGKSNLRTVPDGWRVLKTILRLSSGKSETSCSGAFGGRETPSIVLLPTTAERQVRN